MNNRTAHCSECDSEAISGQAEVAWDFRLQEWTPFDMVNDIYCGDCGEPCSVVWRDEDTQEIIP